MIKITQFCLCSLLSLVALSGCSLANNNKTQAGSTQTSVTQNQRATTAEPRMIDHSWMSLSQWYQRHSDHVKQSRVQNPEVLFLGDSITESWAWGDGRSDVYQNYFSQYAALNFAIGGDMTQNLLWRLQHGLTGKLRPKVAVLMIGTNNFLHQQQSPEEVAAGVQAVIKQIKSNYADIKILTLAILPLHQNANNDSRQYVARANQLISQLADQESVFFLNFSEQFLDKNGDIPAALMTDFIHPTAKGLNIVAEHVAPVLKTWLGK